jgi:hypothetical protein
MSRDYPSGIMAIEAIVPERRHSLMIVMIAAGSGHARATCGTACAR